MSHQSYLEAPYARRDAQDAAYEQFLDSEGIDPDEYDAATLERMFETWVEDMSEPPEPDDDRW